jgi:bifunctional non-homologous end joining protein LigD
MKSTVLRKGIMKPFVPMSPIRVDEVPLGEEWRYQLKWDGYRVIASVDQGKVKLYSKNMLPANGMFPEIVEALSGIGGNFVLDGEAVILDPATLRPSFQKLQQRDKRFRRTAGVSSGSGGGTGGSSSAGGSSGSDDAHVAAKAGYIGSGGRASGGVQAVDPGQVQYVMFDLLQLDGVDLRPRPLAVRDQALRELASGWRSPLALTELFEDGETLWRWVVAHGWEGVVSKQLNSPYREGKQHRNWYKTKIVREWDVEIVGLLIREGRVSSLVMRREGEYFGRNSARLNERIRAELAKLPAGKSWADYFRTPPEDIGREQFCWLQEPFKATVTGSEVTEAGTLRHPKIVRLELK